MEELIKTYQDRLAEISKAIQESEELATYLEEEEDEQYDQLRQKFEPGIHALHEEVAINHPLQIISFERALLDPAFEGLYLPRVLGYSVLRGEVNERFKYIRPQDHFRDIILAICGSSNFEVLKNRIGQTLQVGFALSSKIWISHLLNDVTNKRVHSFLFAQILPKFQEERQRKIGLAKYKRQFESTHFRTAEFPESIEELKILFPSLKTFLLERITRYPNQNDSFLYKIIQLIQNPKLKGSTEYTQLLAIVANFYDLNDNDRKVLSEEINAARAEDHFSQDYFNFLISLMESKVVLEANSFRRVKNLLDTAKKDDLLGFYELVDEIFTKGYIHEDVIQRVRQFYDQHDGLSTVNECLRLTILTNFSKLLANLPETDYAEYFELNKTFTTYMNIFVNQEFNQHVKEGSLKYVKRLLKHFTDKRGRDYQDIKKFVASNFVDLGFLTEKGVVELFKTKRKKKVE